MKKSVFTWLRPILFIATGVLLGLGYYWLVGCSSGTCPLTSSPYITALYGGIMGGLLSVVFCGGRDRCNM